MQYNITNTRSNIFDEFPKYKQQNATSEFRLPSVSVSDNDTVSLYTQNKKKSGKRKILFGSTLASSIITAGVLAMTLGRGVHGSSFVKSGDKAFTGTKKMMYEAGEKLQSISNFTAIKDYFADVALRSNKYTERFADGTTSKFRKIIDGALEKKYDAVGAKVKNMASLAGYTAKKGAEFSADDIAKEIIFEGKKTTIGKLLKELTLQGKSLESAYDDGFSIGARKLRAEKRAKLLSGTKDKIKQRFFGADKGYLNPKNFSNYVTENVTSEGREMLAEEISKAGQKVTHNIYSLKEELHATTESLIQATKMSDKNTLESIGTIKHLAEDFVSGTIAKDGDKSKAAMTQACDLISSVVKNIKADSSYSPEQQKTLIKSLKKMKHLFSSETAPGATERIMSILKALNSEEIASTGKKAVTNEELKEFSKLASGIRKGLKEASETESGQYFLKQAEMEVGSAPTDVFSVLVPLGVGAAAVASGDDKDEKISATLNTCIPLVGTFATFVYGTAKMCFGVKNLALSLGSGLILKKIGSEADQLYKKYKSEGSVVKVAKEQYDTLMNEFNDDKSIKKSKSKK